MFVLLGADMRKLDHLFVVSYFFKLTVPSQAKDGCNLNKSHLVVWSCFAF